LRKEGEVPRISTMWVLGDTHFRHNKMLEVGWPEDWEERTIKNCQKVVRDIDTLIHLGDVMFYYMRYLKGIMSRIPGKKVLIMGNHDSKSKNWFMKNGFDFACDQFVWGPYLFSHRPQRVFPEGVKRNIHGHLHEDNHRSEEVEEFYDPKRHYNVSLSDCGFAPVPLSEISKKLY